MAKISELTDDQLEKNIDKYERKVKEEPEVEKHKTTLKKLESELESRRNLEGNFPENSIKLTSKEIRSHFFKCSVIFLGVLTVIVAITGWEPLLAGIPTLIISYLIKLKCPKCQNPNNSLSKKCKTCGVKFNFKDNQSKETNRRDAKQRNILVRVLIGISVLIFFIAIFPHTVFYPFVLYQINSEKDPSDDYVSMLRECKSKGDFIKLADNDYEDKQISSLFIFVRVYPVKLTTKNKGYKRALFYNREINGENFSRDMKKGITACCFKMSDKKSKKKELCFMDSDYSQTDQILKKSASSETMKKYLWSNMFVSYVPYLFK